MKYELELNCVDLYKFYKIPLKIRKIANFIIRKKYSMKLRKSFEN